MSDQTILTAEQVAKERRMYEDPIEGDKTLVALCDSHEALRARLAQAERVEQSHRRELWLNHGHDALYGDDGEMQCSRCAPVWDYKRMPLDKTEEAATTARNERVAKAWQGLDAAKQTERDAELGRAVRQIYRGYASEFYSPAEALIGIGAAIDAKGAQ